MKLKNKLFLTMFVRFFAALLFAGMFCACVDSGEDDVSADIMATDSIELD